MKRLLLAILSFLPVVLFAHAQQSHRNAVDSLKNQLTMVDSDKEKVDLLVVISMRYRFIDPDSGLVYAQQAMDLATTAKWPRGIALANSAFATSYQYKSDYVKAFEYDTKALRQFEELGDNTEMANTLRSIASTYQYEKNSAKVLEYTNRALKIFQQIGNKSGVASCLSNLGIYYFFEGDYAKALDYDFQALRMWEQVGDRERGASYGNIGDVYMHMGDLGKALEFHFKALDLQQRSGDKYGAAITLGNIGETYYTIATDTTGRLFASKNIPANKSATLEKAIQYLGEAIAVSKEIDQLENIIEFGKYLSDAYLQKGDYKSSLEVFKHCALLQDSVYSIKNTTLIRQSEHSHELAIKDRDIKLANLAIVKKRNERNFLIAGILVLLTVIVIVLRSNAHQKHSNKLLNTEKNRSEELLLNILPSEVATELKEKGTSTAKYFDNVTVMFTDFVNFTKAGERMTPQELVGELDACFKVFDTIVRKHRIEKIKTVGDAYMAVAGLPVDDPDHAASIIKAALEIRDYMKRRRQQMGDKTFEVRIGVHSGNVVAGIVGVIKFAYDIWGDTVNTAARMEEHGAPGKVNISQATYDIVKGRFYCEYRGEIQAKNKGEMAMYFVEPETEA